MFKISRALALTMLLSAVPTSAFSQSSKSSFPCQAGQRVLPDAIDIRDNDHAKAVMRRHPELKALPGYLEESIEGDYFLNTRTAEGRQALVIVVIVDSSDPETGPAVLAKAQVQAPLLVEEVAVHVVGGGGLYALPGFGSETIAPTNGDKVKGIVRIVTDIMPPVIWFSVHVDDNFLASSPPSDRDSMEAVCTKWNSHSVPNGPHTILVKSYGPDNSEIEAIRDRITVNVAN